MTVQPENLENTTLLEFYRSLEASDSQLLKEFCWILEEKFSLNESELLSGILKINSEQKKVLKTWFDKKAQDYPLQYFLNSTAFLDLDFYVEEGALIPRMETEDIVSWVIDIFKEKKGKPRNIIDIGSGSGCMGIALACKLEPDYVELLEPFKDAQKSLKENIKRHCENKEFKTKLVSEPFEEYKFKDKFDLIISNPPYIKKEDPEVTDSVYKYEPHEALYGGKQGFETPVLWFKKSVAHLRENGLLVFEMAYNQRNQLKEELSEFKIEFMKDRFGKDRFFYFIKNN